MTKAELITEIRKLKAEVAQLIQDTESWNDKHPDHLVDPLNKEAEDCNADLDRMLAYLAD